MKFRNFDRIGLENEEDIMKLLGQNWINFLILEESVDGADINKKLHEMGVDAKVKNELIVSLLNEKSNSGMPLVCLIKLEFFNNNLYFTFDTSDSAVRAGHSFKFDTLDKALKFTDRLYGATSIIDVDNKGDLIKSEDEAE